jgi:hypothetical protein
MGKTKTTEMTLAVNDEGASHHIVKQYGMRYPDGTVKWDKDRGDLGFDGYDMWFQHIAENTSSSRSHWEDRLRPRAAKTNVDPEQYALGHTALTRQVIVVITETEEA